MSDMQTLHLRHGDVRVDVQGTEEGRPVLMIHGLSYPLEVWNPVKDGLVQAGYRVIRFDLYGRGRSGWDETPLTSEVMAEQALEVLEALGFSGAVHVVSMSNADLIALSLAALEPGRIRSIVMIAPTGADPRTMNRSTRWSNHPLVRGISASLMVRRLVRRMNAHQSALPEDASPASKKPYAAAIETIQGNPLAASAALSHLANLPGPEELTLTLDSVREFGFPITSVSFGQEQDSTLDGVEAVFSQLRSVNRLNLPEGDHMGVLSQPQTITDLLDGVFSGAGLHTR